VIRGWVAAIMGAYAALLAGLYAVVTRPIQSQLQDITQRLTRMETKQDDLLQRTARLEERTSPLRH
jgi:Mg2+ and Co2+ transporter CorA